MTPDFHKQMTLSWGEGKRTPSLPGQIGPYKIEGLINRGQMSLLYLGLHPETKEMVTVKVLSPEFVTHPEMVSQFLKEAEMIALSKHPNIVKLFGQGKWENGLYIAMEFIRGVSLRQFILQHSLSLKRSIDIILQVAYALHHLHTHGVIHGDLKPENILITEDGEVKVIDFGIARLHSEPSHKEGSSGIVAGTPTYMSPERRQNPSRISFASDIYALGVIAYELSMGKLSFGIIHLALIPKGLRKILEKTLAVSPSERYTNILNFISDLSNYLKSGGLERDRPGTDEVKEVIESLESACQTLSPSTLPDWPSLEFGLAKYKAPEQLGTYYDFFKFSDDSLAICIAETLQGGLDAAVYLGVFRGLVEVLLDEQKKPPRPALFAASLHRHLRAIQLPTSFSLSLLLLNPGEDSLTFLGCGKGGLIHVPQGSPNPRLLPRQNPPLGDPHEGGSPEFFETIDNWSLGDFLTLHSLDTPLEEPLIHALKENLLLSAQGQAEAVLRYVSAHPSFPTGTTPKILITIQRV